MMVSRPLVTKAAALATGVVLVGGALAFASIPDSGSAVFHGCYNKTSGALRVVDPAKSGTQGKCASSEVAITWSQTGPQGAPGPSGAPGAPGVAPVNAVMMLRDQIVRLNVTHACVMEAQPPFGADLSYCDLHDTSLTDGANWQSLNFTGANLSGVSISGGVSGGSFISLNFRFANLRGATLDGTFQNLAVQFADLTGATFTGTVAPALWASLYTICPDGTNTGASGTCVDHMTP
jgi:hypothetical protein